MAVETQDVRPLHILIPTDLHTRLRALADSEERSMAWETRKALEERLDRATTEAAA